MRQIEIVFGGVLAAFGFALLYQISEPQRQEKVTLRCATNLKSVSLAIEQYSDDFDRTLPQAWFGKDAGPSDANSNYKWMDAIFPYAKKESLFNCPNDRSSKPYKFRSGTHYGSYVFNEAYSNSGDKLTPPSGRKMANVADTMTVLVMDGENDFRFKWANTTDAPSLKSNKLGSITVRHARLQTGKVPLTLWVNGLVQGYTMRQVLNEKQTKAQKQYSGLTIEDD